MNDLLRKCMDSCLALNFKITIEELCGWSVVLIFLPLFNRLQNLEIMYGV